MTLAIYFPKQVAIDNPRLWLVQTCCGCATIFIVLFSMVYTKVSYVKTVLPDSLVTPWIVTPSLTQLNMSNIYWGGNDKAATLQARADKGQFNYKPQGYDYVFENPQVAVPCNGLSSSAFDASCMSPGQTHKITKAETIQHVYLEDAIFIPTAYNEEFYTPGKTAANCSFKEKVASGEDECRMKKSYLVPGIEDFEVRFAHKYDVDPPQSFVHGMFNIDRRIKGRLQVAVVDKDGQQLLQFVEDEIVAIPIRNLLELAGLDLNGKLADGAEGTAFPKNVHSSLGAIATPRVTGVEITLEMDYLNDISERISPLCNVRVTGFSSWMATTETQIISEDGSMKTRTYSGIRVRFLRKGKFEYFKFQALFFNVTTLIVWIRIPFFLVFYFAVYCLGTLSKIYSRFLYQDLNLLNEFNGVSARLLKRAHGFNDLHDLVSADGTRALSYQEARRRMYHILEGRKELDENEKDYFISFFFSKTASSIGDDERESLAILLDDYLKVVSSEEPLQYNEIMSLVDRDQDTGHKMTMLEQLFIDSSLKQFLQDSKKRNSRSSLLMLEEGAEAGVMAMDSSQSDTMDSAQSEFPWAAPGPTVNRASSASSEIGTGTWTMGKVLNLPIVNEGLMQQADMFTVRITAQKLSIKMDELAKELDIVRQSRDKLQEHHTDHLHYLKHLQEKVIEADKNAQVTSALRNRNTVGLSNRDIRSSQHKATIVPVALEEEDVPEDEGQAISAMTRRFGTTHFSRGY